MGKNNIFFGQPIFSQLINLLSKQKIDKIAKEHQSDRYCKRFTCFQHLITVLYGVTSGCNSLRELSLFQPIFECVGRNPSNGKRKGGIKSYKKLDVQAGIPV